MKFIGIFLSITLVLGVIAFGAVAMMDIPVAQTQVIKSIPNERFYAGGQP